MYDKIEVEAYECRCEKCGHQWTSLKVDPPTHCANKRCTNPTKWNEPGRSRRYHLTTKTPAYDPVTVADDFDFGA